MVLGGPRTIFSTTHQHRNVDAVAKYSIVLKLKRPTIFSLVFCEGKLPVKSVKITTQASEIVKE